MHHHTNIRLNRELESIKFFYRILLIAMRPSTPILERIRYLSIIHNNCNELSQVRLSKLLKLHKNNSNYLLDDNNLSIPDTLKLIKKSLLRLYKRVDICYLKTIEQLNSRGFQIISCDNSHKVAYTYYQNHIKPYIKLLSGDECYLTDQVYFCAQMNCVTRKPSYTFNTNNYYLFTINNTCKALIEVKKNRFINFQDMVSYFFVLDNPHAISCHAFTVARSIMVEGTEKNINSITQMLVKRQSNPVMKINVTTTLLRDQFINSTVLVLRKIFNVSHVYKVKHPLNLSLIYDHLSKNLPIVSDLLYKNYVPQSIQPNDIWYTIDSGDILLYTPYQSFNLIQQLLKHASVDQSINSIKITLYRINQDSQIIKYLINAHNNGKQVVVFIEPSARFNEEINLNIAKLLKHSGIKVIYGINDYKVHAKCMLISRVTNNVIKYYAHISSGNYHETTANCYTDLGIITSNDKITNDLLCIFNYIENKQQSIQLQYLLATPFNMRDEIMEYILYESKMAQDGRMASIIIKINALLDLELIDALYSASNNGVTIQIIVRGACLLVPGIDGMSKNITVKSVMGQMLEHSRIMYFLHGGNEKVFILSADWMPRNFFKRIECAVPIIDLNLKQQIIDDCLNVYLKDNQDSYVASYKKNDLIYTYIGRCPKSQSISAQQNLIQKYHKT